MLQNKEWWEKYANLAARFYVWVVVAPNHKIAVEVTKEEAHNLAKSGFERADKIHLFFNGVEIFIG